MAGPGHKAYGFGSEFLGGLDIPELADPTTEDFNQYKQILNYTPEEKYSFLSHVYGKSVVANRLTSLTAAAPVSLANRYALFTWFGLHGSPNTDVSKYYRDYYQSSVIRPESAAKPTTSKLIEYFQEKSFGGIEYAWSDFLWATYHNKIPNNYLLTLRRFPMPCEDNIYNMQKNELITPSVRNEENEVTTDAVTDLKDITMPDISRAVTWMSDATGNKMEDILSFGYGYNWKEQKAEVNSTANPDEGYTSHPIYEKLGSHGRTMIDMIKGVTPAEKARRLRLGGHDPLMETYENFVLGPHNVINSMMTKDVGLNFSHDIKLNFKYSLKSYAGINPKIAMLDIMANLLVLTYSNANFFGGANRFYGGGGYVASRFGDMSKLLAGDYKGYLGTVVDEVGAGFKDVFGDVSTNTFGSGTLKGFLEGLNNVGGAVLQNMIGGFVNKQLGAAPAFQALKGFISGEATGEWHLTVGNPINPIAMFGNLILNDSNISFGGGLGRDDFPLELNMNCTLKHARPRDKSDFESAFNAGKGRLYAGAEGFADVLNLEGAGNPNAYGVFSQKDVDDALGLSTFHSPEGAQVEKITQTGVTAVEHVSDKLVGFKKWGKNNGILDAANSRIHL